MKSFQKTESEAFFTSRAVFTAAEFGEFLARRSEKTAASEEARQTLLRHHEQRGRILRIRRGLYASIPPGQSAETYPIDTFLIASQLTDDAVLSHHTALSLHGVAHSVRENRLVLSSHKSARSLAFRGVRYKAMLPPSALPPSEALTMAVETLDRQGSHLRVTTLERTLVDVLDRPILSGGWEEVWRSLQGVDVYLDMSLLTRYTLALNEATIAAKVGYYLDTNRERLKVSDSVLQFLRCRISRQPHYVERGKRQDARLISKWNLLVPASVFMNEAGFDTSGGGGSGDASQSPRRQSEIDDEAIEDIPV